MHRTVREKLEVGHIPKVMHLTIWSRDPARRTVWFLSPRFLPCASTMQRWLLERPEIELLFPRPFAEAEKQRVLTQLQSALPNCRVWDAPYPKHRQRLFVARILDETTILRHARQVTDAARDFERVAKERGLALAAHLEVDATDMIALGRFMRPEFSAERQIGELAGGWRYFFHGIECGFSNQQSGQRLEIVFGYENQWGVLDASFFEEFVKSTPAHHAVAALFQSRFADAQRTLEVLEAKGYFVRVSPSPRSFGQREGLVVAPSTP